MYEEPKVDVENSRLLLFYQFYVARFRTILTWGVSMSRLPRFCIALLALALVGCTSSPAPSSESEGEPNDNGTVVEQPQEPGDSSSSGSVPEGFHPVDVTTGIAEVDSVLKALGSSDLAELERLITFSEVACTTETYGMPGLPRCQENEADGTPTSVFPTATCNITYLASAEDVAKMVKGRLNEPRYVYAVYRPDEKVGNTDLAYAIVIARSLTDDQTQTIYLDSSGAIRQWHGGCGAVPSEAVPEGVEHVLPPKSQ